MGDRRIRLAEEFWGKDRDARDCSNDQYWRRRRRRIDDERNREMGREFERGCDGERDLGRDTQLERARGDYECGFAIGRGFGRDIGRDVEVERGREDDCASSVLSHEGDGSVDRDANNSSIPEFIMRAQNEERDVVFVRVSVCMN